MRVGDALPSPFTISIITYKVVVYAPAESPYFISTDICTLWGTTTLFQSQASMCETWDDPFQNSLTKSNCLFLNSWKETKLQIEVTGAYRVYVMPGIAYKFQKSQKWIPKSVCLNTWDDAVPESIGRLLRSRINKLNSEYANKIQDSFPECRDWVFNSAE